MPHAKHVAHSRKANRSEAAKIVRIELIKGGLQVRDLAKALELDARYLSNVIGGRAYSRVCRRRIEEYFGIIAWPTDEG